MLNCISASGKIVRFIVEIRSYSTDSTWAETFDARVAANAKANTSTWLFAHSYEGSSVADLAERGTSLTRPGKLEEMISVYG